MKKILKIIGIIVVILPVLFMIYIPIANDFSAVKTKNRLKNISLPKNTQYIEAISKAGKLTGNGNGMQYFGAILIKSELSKEELSSYYSNYNADDWYCSVEKQKGQQIAFIEHDTLLFKTDISSEGQYYIIYACGNGNELFSELDIRGH